MWSTLTSLPALALCVALQMSAVHAQTFCNPLKNASCPADPALGGMQTFDFTKGASDAFYNIGGGAPTYGPQGVSFTAAKSGDSPTLVSKFYIMYGRVDTVMQVAPGSGICSASVLMSDDADEIDWEALGGDPNNIQTNFFSQGIAPAGTEPTSGNPSVPGAQTGFHTYTVEWTQGEINWMIDGVSVVSRTTATSTTLPQTPVALKIGIWAPGDPANNPNGPNGWAGATDWSQGPFTMIVQSVAVTDYSTGQSYSYSGTSGSYSSISSNGGTINMQEVGSPAQVQFDGASAAPAAAASAPAAVAAAAPVAAAPVAAAPAAATSAAATSAAATPAAATSAAATPAAAAPPAAPAAPAPAAAPPAAPAAPVPAAAAPAAPAAPAPAAAAPAAGSRKAGSRFGNMGGLFSGFNPGGSSSFLSPSPKSATGGKSSKQWWQGIFRA